MSKKDKIKAVECGNPQCGKVYILPCDLTHCGCGERIQTDLSELSNEDKFNPNHYKSHPSGVECIQITEHMNFNIGNAIKYLWRNGLKSSETSIDDLNKAKWYIEREIQRLEK